MTLTAATRVATPRARLAASAGFRTFALVFAVATPVIYVVCEMRNWPLFTYHPGTSRFDWFYAPAVRDQGPAMYWYGWTAHTLIGSAILGGVAAQLPARVVRKIPLALAWIAPLAATPLLVFALRYYWRW